MATLEEFLALRLRLGWVVDAPEDVLAKLLRIHQVARVAEDDDIFWHQLALPEREQRRQDLLAREVAVGTEDAHGGEDRLGQEREGGLVLALFRAVIVGV